MQDPGIDQKPTAVSELVNRICDEFEAEWKRGAEPDLASFLKQASSQEAEERLFPALMALELQYQRARGISVDTEAYCAQFPMRREAIKNVFASAITSSNSGGSQTSEFETLQDVASGTDNESTKDFLPRAHPARERSPQSRELVQIGPYIILNTIAEHGQGVVYRANHPTLHRQVVIKVSNARARVLSPEGLMAEARVLAQMNHPNIATIYDLQTDSQGRPYLVMEYIEGRNLAEVLRESRFTPEQTVELLIKVCQGLQHAHDLGVLHLDLKPANIVLRATDKLPKIIDFGLAQFRPAYGMQDSSSQGGTLRYMAPEQATMLLPQQAAIGGVKELDARADVYAIGAILYEMVTGKNLRPEPVDIQSALRVASSGSFDTEILSDCGIPVALKNVCLKALAINPADRLATAGEFAEQLRVALDNEIRPSHLSLLRWSVMAGLATLLVAGTYLVLQRGNGNKNDSRITSPNGTGDSKTVNEIRTPILQAELFEKSPSGDVLYRKVVGRDIVAARYGQLVRLRVQLPEPRYCYLIGFNPTDRVEDQIQLLYPADKNVVPDPLEAIEFPSKATDFLPLTDGVGQQVFLLVHSRDPLPGFKEWSTRIGDRLAWSRVNQPGAWDYQDGKIQPIVIGNTPKERAAIQSIEPTLFRDQLEQLRKAIDGTSIGLTAIAFPVRDSNE